LFPQPPQPESILSCAEAGVLGVLPGMIGTLQATEVLKLITGLGKPLVNQLFTYNALTNESLVFGLAGKKETASLLPKSAEEFEQLDYEWLCGNVTSVTEELDAANFTQYLQKENTAVIDVREKGEQPAVTEFLHQQIPLSVLRENVSAIKEDTVILFCQSGKRSREAARILSATFGTTKNIYSLKGGITNWKKHGKKEA
jgi:adenylyltransferase/sulfurtransferase